VTPKRRKASPKHRKSDAKKAKKPRNLNQAFDFVDGPNRPEKNFAALSVNQEEIKGKSTPFASAGLPGAFHFLIHDVNKRKDI